MHHVAHRRRLDDQDPHLSCVVGVLLFRHQRRVEARVVVHLELAVDLEVRAAGAAVGQQRVEAGGQIGALLVQPLELGRARAAMRLVDVAPLGLGAHRVHLQRHDRQPVDHAAGSLAVQPRAGAHRRHRRVGARRSRVDQPELGEQQFVDTLGGVVARLVVAVDRAFVGGDLGVGHLRAPRQVFLGPQQTVEAVVGLDPQPQRRRRGPAALARATRAYPAACRAAR